MLQTFKLIKLIDKIDSDFFKKFPYVSEFIGHIILLALVYSFFEYININHPTAISIIIVLSIFIIRLILIRINTTTLFFYGFGDTYQFPLSSLSWLESKLIQNKNQLCLGSNNDDINILPATIIKADYESLQKFSTKNKIKKIYVCGLARIPFLVVYGTLLYPKNWEIIYLEKSHDSNKWFLLPQTCSSGSADCDIDIKLASPTPDGDVALVISFSSRINHESLPANLKANVAEITSCNVKRNFVKDIDQLNIVMSKIIGVLDELSGNRSVKIIHLFAAVQTIVAIEIGKRYQIGSHKPMKIYNYSPKDNKYNYFLSVPLSYE